MDIPLNQQVIFISTLFVLTLPLLSSLLSFSIAERYSWLVNANAPLLLLISFSLSIYVATTGWDLAPFTWSISWFRIGDASINFSFLLTRSSMLMMVVVAAVSFLVHLYSTSYMAWDENIRRYFAVLGFFTFAMQGVVLSDNLLVLFIFWELMGFASYLLIGHWTEDVLAGQASKKAFIVNKIGDVSFFIGLLIIYTNLGTFSISEIMSAPSISNWQTAAGLCIFAGVIGKSAQFPLFIWLPDAMKGPTPVSALIHAATMVAAGVYLMIRLFPFFTPAALTIIAVIGMITAVLGAITALHQFDIKKILAYSTISQLGLMVTAVGMGAPDAAFLHLLTHAFFKACLFLSAGAVIQSFHLSQKQNHDDALDPQDIRNYGGLKKVLPITFITFLISASALAGIPFFSGFISKEAIVSDVWNKIDGSSFYLAIFVGIIITSFCTVLYAFRMFWFVFLAPPENNIHNRMVEVPVVMRVPMIILAMASLWIIVSLNPLDSTSRFIEQTSQHSFGWLSIASSLWVFLALVTAYFLFRKRRPTSSILIEKGFYLDRAFSFASVRLMDSFSHTIIKADRKIFDQAIHGGAYAYITIAHMVNWIDRFIVDGIVNLLAGLIRWIGSITRSFQGGKIQQYIFWALFAIIIFLIWSLN